MWVGVYTSVMGVRPAMQLYIILLEDVGCGDSHSQIRGALTLFLNGLDTWK